MSVALAGLLFAGAGPARAETLFAVTDASPPVLESFDSATPGTVSPGLAVTGLQAGEKLWGIATRPATGQLYGVGSTQRVYVINPATGAAAQVGAGPFTPAVGDAVASHGVTFDPVADQLRVVGDTAGHLNLRIDPSTAVATQETPWTGGTSGVSVQAAGYDNQLPGAASTTLFDYDYQHDELDLQGSRAGSPMPASSGALTVIGPTGIATAAGVPHIGMAVSPAGNAYGALQTAAGTKLYTVNMATGAVTLIGAIGSGSTLIDGLAAPGVRNVFAFTQSGYSVSEHGGSAMVTVARSQSAGTGSVNYSTTDGGAHAGSQYVASAGTLSFASGQSEARFSVPVIDEHAVGGTKTLTLSLSGPVGGSASLGSPASAALTILDDDTPIVAAPSVTNATESHSRWRRGNHLATFTTNHPLPVGTTFSFALNEPATVKFAFTQKLGGRKVKGKCVAQTRKSRPKPACKRIVTRGTLTFAGHAGTNKVFFQGPISTRKKLQPGRYTLVITATDSARRHSNTKSLSFTIVN